MNKSINLPKERPQRRKTPAFSTILLDSIYHSIDETKEVEQTKHNFYRTDNVLVVEQDVKSLRRAIMLEKWMETHSSYACSSADSSFFSETESSSRCTPKSLSSSSEMKHLEKTQHGVHESRFMRTKSKVLKIYGDLKKVKQPMSPGTKIANFLNSVFSSRNLKKRYQHQSATSEGWSSMRKSRSVKDPTIFSSLTSRSCLSKAPSSRTKSKRSVRFGNVSVIEQYDPRMMTIMPKVGNNLIRENIHNLPSFQSRDTINHEESDEDDDIRSCTSSDLFELENICVVANQMDREELPVFATTNMKINQTIANGYQFS
ncbi:hypothetical protein LIER_31060 [Lithospermum erythrorhizon]|uniref:Protein BIG GRAIN 1-like B n=1 Tax=Lithospermum erythrorhizon TaxID=34254 RepID=A0AAV3RV25_LITER